MIKNKLIIAIAVVLLIIVIIFVKNQAHKNNVNYKIDEIQNYNYFLYHIDGKVGVIERNGNIVIEANYDKIDIPNIERDVFICYSDDKRVVFNSSNEIIFDEYEDIEPIIIKNAVSVLHFEKSVLKYKKDNKYGLIDFDGKEITKNIYDSIENLQGTEGKFLVKKEEKYGVINLKGTELVKINYSNVKTDSYYNDDLKYVNAGFITGISTDDGYKYGYIRYDGKKILNEEFTEITRIPFQDEIYLIASKNGKFGLYKNSKNILEHIYHSISYTDNGVLIVQKNKKYGISNLDGQILVDLNYNSIEEKGIYLYAKNVNESVVYNAKGEKQDINFNKVIYETENSKYKIITLLNNNILYYGIEDNKGNTLLLPSYNYIEYLFDDYFVAKNNMGYLGVISSKGTILVDFKYDTLQKIKGKDMLQAIETRTKNLKIYSSKLEVLYEDTNAILDNKNGYIALISNDEIKYFDENGNILEEGSEVLESIGMKNFPEKIGEYKKVQVSIDYIYYE